MPENFQYDVFLSHSSKDKDIVRPLAERLRKDGLRVWFDEWQTRPGESISAKVEEGLERSRVLVLCMSANAFGSDWIALESQTFRFRDPLNKERRFIPLRLDEAPIKGSLAQVPCFNWLPKDREWEYEKLLEACQAPLKASVKHALAESDQVTEKTFQLDTKPRVWDYAFSPDGRSTLTGGHKKTGRVWDLETGHCLRVFEGHTAKVFSVAWSADQRRALSGSVDKTVGLWDTETGRRLRVLIGHREKVWTVAWSTDQKYAISGSLDKTVRLWDVETGRCLRVLEGHKSDVNSVAWKADDYLTLILSGSSDNTVRLWDVVAGHCLSILEGHTGAVKSVAWNTDQNRALSGSSDRTVRLWDLEMGRCLRVLEGHTGEVTSVAWNADQRHGLSGSSDRTVRLWDLEMGRCLHVLEGHESEVRTVAWSPDQLHALSGDSRGGIRVWDLSEFFKGPRVVEIFGANLPTAPDQIQYTNAKVLLVGDTSSGKTGLAHRLATGTWRPTDGSTAGAWSTQWRLRDSGAEPGVEREIWLWDFGGQADQRLIHQLYMDRAALILLLFNADQEDVLPGLRDWQTALRRCVPLGSRNSLSLGVSTWALRRVAGSCKGSLGNIISVTTKPVPVRELDATNCVPP